MSSSSSIGKHWEAELEALKGNNAKLTAALLESTANVKQWKQQLAAYQEEAERLHKRVRRRPSPRGGGRSWGPKDRVLCVSGDGVGVREQPNHGDQIPKDRTQPNDRRAGGGSEGQGGGAERRGWRKRAVASRYSPLVSSFQELQRLKAEVESANEFQTQKDSLTLKLQVRETRPRAGSDTSPAHAVTASLFQDTESRNQTLEAQLRELEQRLESSQQERDAFHKSLRSLLELLDSKIFELTELRDTLAKLLQSS